MKVLTLLNIKLTKIKLRNYFSKYWCNVKYVLVEVDRSGRERSRGRYISRSRVTLWFGRR